MNSRIKKIAREPEGSSGLERPSWVTGEAREFMSGRAPLGAAQVRPIDIRTKVFATNIATGFSLNVRAALGRNLTRVAAARPLSDKNRRDFE